MKYCKKCDTTKSLDMFSKSIRHKDGKLNVCKVCSNIDKTKWRQANMESHLAYNREYYLRNKERYYKNLRNWKLSNSHTVIAQKAKRRATKLSATPSWLTDEHLQQIADTYWLAKDLEAISGEQYHVDHIVPLQGKDVCGLHVPWNLQVLPADINLKKSNK